MYPVGVGLTSKISNIKGRVFTSPIASDALSSLYNPEEVETRNKLASLYRLIDLHDWSQNIYNHITARIPGEANQILINPFGLLYSEITASNLIKIDLEGNILDRELTQFGINQAGLTLHSALHEANEKNRIVLHMHVPCVVAVSSMKCGLLPICQEAMIIGNIAYHDYQGILVDADEKKSLVEDLGSKNVMLLRNHGFVVCAETIEKAFLLAYHVILACDTQVKAFSAGMSEVIVPSPKAANQAFSTASKGGGGVDRKCDGKVDTTFGIGELEWEAAMRILDRMGLVTGHKYRRPL